MRKDLSLRTKLIVAATIFLALPIAVWLVLFASNRSVEARLAASQRDLARVSSLRALISLTEKISAPVLNAANDGSDLNQRDAELKTASANAVAALVPLEDLFTAEEAQASGYADVRARLESTIKDAARIMEILTTPEARKKHEVDAEFEELRTSLPGKSSGVVTDVRKLVETETKAAGEGLIDARATSIRSQRIALAILLLFVVAVPLIARSVGRSISEPVAQVTRVHQAIVSGDFDQ
ncbi:MAG: hypothetical protein ABI672_13415, partial [Vicinamibacteria bacterium]